MSKIYEPPPGWSLGPLRIANDFYKKVDGAWEAQLFEVEPDRWAIKFRDHYRNNLDRIAALQIIEKWVAGEEDEWEPKPDDPITSNFVMTT